MAEIELSGKHGKGLKVILDDDDYERFKNRKWHLLVGRYAANGHDYLHRLIMNAPKGTDVDHLNHNTLDCRKKNLRVVSHTENCQNTKSPGYYYEKWSNKWHVEYRKVNYGRYKTEAENYNGVWQCTKQRLSIELKSSYWNQPFTRLFKVVCVLERLWQ